MANISGAVGVWSGTSALVQAYFSRQVSSVLFTMLPILGWGLALQGDKNSYLGIGTPDAKTTIVGRGEGYQMREKNIYSADTYQPLIHGTPPDDNDTAGGIGVGAPGMPQVGGLGAQIAAGLTATLGGPASSQGVASVTIVSSGYGYGATLGTLTATGGGGTGFAGIATMSNGIVTSVLVTGTGGGYSSPPIISLSGSGTPTDQHFDRPFSRWYEVITPLSVNKKSILFARNLMANAERGEKEMVLSDLMATATKEGRATHFKRLAQEMWGIRNTTGLPTDQTQQNWDHMLSLPSAMHTTNTYGGVDRTVAANSYYLGLRETANKPANIVQIYNEIFYDKALADYGPVTSGKVVAFCGPTLFQQFQDQARTQSGFVVYQDGPPEMYQFGCRAKCLKYQDMWVVLDPMCPDKARTDPRTGSAYTKNALMAINFETFTVAFMPDRKFTIDPFFDKSHIDGADVLNSRIRTMIMAICESPPVGGMYFEDVG